MKAFPGQIREQFFLRPAVVLPFAAVPAITIKYERGAAKFAARLFGFRPADDELAFLAGALDGATVNVSVRVKKDWLFLAVDDPAHFFRKYLFSKGLLPE